MYSGSYSNSQKKPILPPSYSGSAFTNKPCECEKGQDNCRKPILTPKFTRQELLLLALIVLLTEQGCDEMLVVILSVTLAVGL